MNGHFRVGYNPRSRQVFIENTCVVVDRILWFSPQDAAKVANALLEAKNRVEGLDQPAPAVIYVATI